MKKSNWRTYGFEFLSIFIAVIAAFALNNWNENRRDNAASLKILAEIANGLEKDIVDVKVNKQGHNIGINACNFWINVVNDTQVNMDTMVMHYFNLTRDYISIQNVSGYESLKSKGLELIDDDELRFDIIALYEYDYSVLKKFEEEYHEMQYDKNYFKEINAKIAPHLNFDEQGNVISINTPLNLDETDRKILLSYLWKIKLNRNFILQFYDQTEEKINALRSKIKDELN